MKIRFVEYIYPESYNFDRIIREAGYAHEVDAGEVEKNIWYGGTRELGVALVLDTETGIIKVDEDQTI